MASPSIIGSGSVSTLSLGKPVESWPGSYVEFSGKLPSLSPNRSHNEVEDVVGSSRHYATGPLRASTLSNCDRSLFRSLRK
jgi:hypothetical protein